MRRPLLIVALTLLATWASFFASSAHAANWQINRMNHLVLTPPGGVTVAEMSGVTYLGPAGGNHRFIAAEETKGELVQFDLTLSAAGAITSITNVTAVDIVPTLDFEGVAYTNAARNSVFISDENGPGVRELSLATGAEMQNVVIPPVFVHRIGNKGFESLTRTLDAGAMWTANEEALTVDGPSSEGGGATVVRLLKLNVSGNSVSTGSQFAYQVEPIHGGPVILGAQSGLSDLVAMPDGVLLGLERSLASGSPLFLNRIFEIDFASATDVSVGPAAAGLIGQTYTPVAKQLLWSGAADGSGGQNLEGLTLGPRLANGSWTLVGVVDDGDPFSNNTIVAFTATAIPSADFDDDNDVDGDDLLHWQRGLGKTIGATHAEGDADRDGDVDDADLTLWKAAFGSPAIAASEIASATVPEPSTALLTLCGLAVNRICRRRLRRRSRSQSSS